MKGMSITQTTKKERTIRNLSGQFRMGEMFGDELCWYAEHMYFEIQQIHMKNGEIAIKVSSTGPREYLWYDPDLDIFIEGYEDGPIYEHIWTLTKDEMETWRSIYFDILRREEEIDCYDEDCINPVL